MFSHTFHIDPVAKGRPRFGKGFTYTPAKTKKFESTIKQLAKKAILGDPIKGALSVSVLFYMQKPKTTKNLLPVVRPDLDNLLKGLLDALNGIFFEDDSQICFLNAKKIYGSVGKIEISIERIVL